MSGITTTSARIGQVIDKRYLVRTEVGRGEFGVVFRVSDLDNQGEQYALKTLRSAQAGDATQVQRIARETEICMQLEHPNTARLFDHGVIAATSVTPAVPYLVFELVRGLPLGDLLEERFRLTLDETVHILASVLDSLEEAHNLGIVHRDLKPNNIMVVCDADDCTKPVNAGERWQRLGIPPADDVAWFDVSEAQVKVVDFGLGKFLQPDSGIGARLTAAGSIAGTARFMSPEQARGQAELTNRADIYGMAMLLHMVLIGRPVFDAPSTLAVALQHINEPLPPLPEPWGSHPINAIFERAGAKRPEDRFVSAAEMAHALRALVDDRLASSPRPDFVAPSPSPKKPRKRSRLLNRLFGQDD